MAVKLNDLPYGYTALEPYIGEKTLRIHHGKHHARYVTVANELIQNTDMANDDVVTLIRKAHAQKNTALFNNIGQVFNHDFYWHSMKPNGGGKPSGRLATLIDRDFGGYDAFREAFVKAAATVFGSGWAWLVHTPQGLKVTQSIGAGNPHTEPGQVPLLTIDVWEHAYYLDYQNLRPTYIDTFMDRLVDWEAVASRLPAE
jgi:Fe-Mn family superoxide dismutase